MTNNFRWQVPGNGRAFDSAFDEWQFNKMSERSIGVLCYINHKINVDISTYEKEILKYLKSIFNHTPNESNKKHFYRPLEFVGLIRNQYGKLSLSIDGKNFLKNILNKNYNAAWESYILQLLKTSYPNSATKNIKLQLFPFRIIFKLFLDKGYLSKKDFLFKIPYIESIENIENIENINGKKYDKWVSWILSSFTQLNILYKEQDRYCLTKNANIFLKQFLMDSNYSEMFFNNENYIELKNNIRKVKRDQNLIHKVLKKSDYSCFFDSTHYTFPSKTRPNYVEGHHIIPISLKDSFEEELDCEDNIISLCPNCHKLMHYAIPECKEEYLKIILENTSKLKSFNIVLDDLREVYCGVK